MKKIIYIIMCFIFIPFVMSDTLWKDNPYDCPTSYQSQDCTGSDVSCGYNSGILYCYNPTLLTVSQTRESDAGETYQSSLNPGFIINCYQYDNNNEPWCDNSPPSGKYWCNRNQTCFNTFKRRTNCSNFKMGLCGNCRTNYYACDGSIEDNDGCEILTSATCSAGATYDGNCYGSNGNCTCNIGSNYYDCDNDDIDNNNETGQVGSDGCEIQLEVTQNNSNSLYTSCNTFKCVFGYNDCDGFGDGTDANGCEIQNGASCNIAGLPGVYDGCDGSIGNCVINKSYFETGTKANYSTALPLLWGQQYGSGWLINMTNSINVTWGVDYNGCINFPDGTSQCSASGGGSMWNISTSKYLYNNSGILSINETKLNATINIQVDDAVTDKWVNETGDTMTGDLNMGVYTLYAQDINISYIHSAFSSSIANIRASPWYLANAGWEVAQGYDFCINNSVCLSTVNTNTWWNIQTSRYLYNDSGIIDVNETRLNATIISITDARDNNTWWPITEYVINDTGSLNVNETMLNNTIDNRINSSDIWVDKTGDNMTGDYIVNNSNFGIFINTTCIVFGNLSYISECS